MFALALDASLTFLCDGGNVAAPGQLGSRYPPGRTCLPGVTGAQSAGGRYIKIWRFERRGCT